MTAVASGTVFKVTYPSGVVEYTTTEEQTLDNFKNSKFGSALDHEEFNSKVVMLTKKQADQYVAGLKIEEEAEAMNELAESMAEMAKTDAEKAAAEKAQSEANKLDTKKQRG